MLRSRFTLLIVKLLFAFKIRLPSRKAEAYGGLSATKISARTLRLPTPVPVPAVVTVTLTPALNALAIETLLTVAVARLLDQVTGIELPGSPVIFAVLAALVIFISVGSISHMPLFVKPPALTLPNMPSCSPEVSTKPPSPLELLTLMSTLESMYVCLAMGTDINSLTIFRLSPPMITLPPAPTPLASTDELPNNPTRPPDKTTVPPVAFAPLPETSIAESDNVIWLLVEEALPARMTVPPPVSPLANIFELAKTSIY